MAMCEAPASVWIMNIEDLKMRHTCNFCLFTLLGRGKWVCHQTTAPFSLCNSLKIINPWWATWQLTGCRKFDVWQTISRSPAKTLKINNKSIKCNGGGGSKMLPALLRNESKSKSGIDGFCPVVMPHLIRCPHPSQVITLPHSHKCHVSRAF